MSAWTLARSSRVSTAAGLRSAHRTHCASVTVSTSWPLGSTTAVRVLFAMSARAQSPNDAHPSSAHPSVTVLHTPLFLRCATAADWEGKTSRPGAPPYSRAPVVLHTLMRRQVNDGNGIGQSVGGSSERVRRGGGSAERPRCYFVPSDKGAGVVGVGGVTGDCDAPYHVRIDAPRRAQHEVQLSAVALHRRDGAPVPHVAPPLLPHPRVASLPGAPIDGEGTAEGTTGLLSSRCWGRIRGLNFLGTADRWFASSHTRGRRDPG